MPRACGVTARAGLPMAGSALETYLNLVIFRGKLQRIAAASRGLFNKTLAGSMPPNPGSGDPFGRPERHVGMTAGFAQRLNHPLRLERGIAWIYRKYNRDRSLLAQEHEARAPSVAGGPHRATRLAEKLRRCRGRGQGGRGRRLLGSDGVATGSDCWSG
jgi:hypothetical protein